MENRRKLIPIIIELVGISAVGTGIGLEISLGGQIYLVVITIGSCLLAVGSIIWGKFTRGVNNERR